MNILLNYIKGKANYITKIINIYSCLNIIIVLAISCSKNNKNEVNPSLSEGDALACRIKSLHLSYNIPAAKDTYNYEYDSLKNLKKIINSRFPTIGTFYIRKDNVIYEAQDTNIVPLPAFVFLNNINKNKDVGNYNNEGYLLNTEN